jgi:hypothetical protein
VAVAEIEQGAFGEDREMRRRSGRETPVIHVAAIGAAGRGGDRLTFRRRDPETADHRREVDRPIFQRRRRLGQLSDCALAVDGPDQAPAFRHLTDMSGIDDVGRERREGPASVARRRQADDLDAQTIARRRALDEERPGHRIGL